MDTCNKFSCFTIGERTLPIQCAEILFVTKGEQKINQFPQGTDRD